MARVTKIPDTPINIMEREILDPDATRIGAREGSVPNVLRLEVVGAGDDGPRDAGAHDSSPRNGGTAVGAG